MTRKSDNAPKTGRKRKSRKRPVRKPGRPAKKTSAAEIKRRERVADIMSLRLQGWSLEAIGDAQEPKITSQRVHQIISQHLTETATMATEEVRLIEIQRLDEMQIKLFEGAVKGDLLAVDRVLKLIAQRASLMGLNAPTKINVAGHNGGPIEHEHTVAIADAAASFDGKLARLFQASDRRQVPGQPE